MPRIIASRSLPAALLAGALAAAGLAAGAGDLARFELDDGSVVVGEPLSLADGVYRIRTPALGEVTVDASRVRRMSRADDTGGGAAGAWGAAPGAPTGADPAAAVSAADIEGLQRRLIGDQGVMESIMALQQDPQLKAALADPELMGLVMSGNIEALRNHPAFGRLMNHEGIRAIIEQVVGPDGQLR
jgi:hypothetical protein